MQTIQMHLSRKHFSEFSCAFFEAALSLEHAHSLCISEITDHKKRLSQMSKSSRFGEPLDRQHGKRAEALIQS